MAQRDGGRARRAISWRQFIALAALAVGGYFLFSFGNLVVSAYRLGSETEALRSEISALKAENESLQHDLEALQGEAAVEAIARSELGWTKPGEVQIVVDVEPAASVVLSKPPPPQEPVTPNWRLWLDMILQPEP